MNGSEKPQGNDGPELQVFSLRSSPRVADLLMIRNGPLCPFGLWSVSRNRRRHGKGNRSGSGCRGFRGGLALILLLGERAGACCAGRRRRGYFFLTSGNLGI